MIETLLPWGARGDLDLIVKQQSPIGLKTLSRFAIHKNLLCFPNKSKCRPISRLGMGFHRG
jgi:hypothetical protein